MDPNPAPGGVLGRSVPRLEDRPLLTGRGYREVRRFWDMTIELADAPPPDPRLPEGFSIEPFSAENARAFHAALEEAFADHWEFQPTSFEKWWERQVAKPDHDPSLWFLIRADELKRLDDITRKIRAH